MDSPEAGIQAGVTVLWNQDCDTDAQFCKPEMVKSVTLTIIAENQ